jgi:hypothetical protein
LGFCEAVGIKAFGHERLDIPLGRRGKPVKKVRFMPMAKAHELARKLQGRLNTTISVIYAQGGPAGPLSPGHES